MPISVKWTYDLLNLPPIALGGGFFKVVFIKINEINSVKTRQSNINVTSTKTLWIYNRKVMRELISPNCNCQML